MVFVIGAERCSTGLVCRSKSSRPTPGHSRWQTTADWYIESDREGKREGTNVAARLLEVGKGRQSDSPQIVSAVSVKLDKQGEPC
jgi:hypothetical protein